MKVIFFLIWVVYMKLESISGNSDLISNLKSIFGPLPKKTPGPININTSQVVDKHLPWFSLHGIASEKCHLVNNGKSIELLLDQPFSGSFITGGIFGKDIFQLQKKIYYFTNRTNGVAGTTIDGKGVPLNADTFFFNQKYGSFKKALEHRDGMVRLNYLIGICSFSNPLFEIFYAEKVKQVRNAGSSAETTLGAALVWYSGFLFPFDYYYTYPGSYYDETTDKFYYSATVVTIPNLILECLSKKQFEETWGSLKDASGNSLFTAQPRHNPKTKIVKSIGIVQTISPPTSKKTPDPININTSQAHSKILPLIFLHGYASDKCKLINNGKSVELLLDQPTSESVITGGILGKEKYHFYKKIYFWTNNTNGIAATTIDGKGVPLNADTFFYNGKYKSFKNALNYPGGLVKLDFFVRICSTSNPLFDIFYAEKVKQVRNAGSSAETTLGAALVWYSAFLLPFDHYYAYQGSYYDETTDKFYYNVKTIVLPHLISECLSKKQFDETWGSLKDSSGNPLTHTASRYNRSTQVVKSSGIVQIISP